MRVLIGCRRVVDGWTAGQVAEHLLIIEHMALTVLSGKTVPADRDPQDHVNTLQKRLVDRVNKLEAFPAIMPSDASKEPQALIEKLIAARKNLIDFVRDHDMTLLLPERPNRVYGVLSGIEWVQFWIHHANRHIKQLELL
ncbi:MAG: DinB family protein [Bacteroidota bacterium]